MADIADIKEPGVDAGQDREGKYLTFTLAGEQYGIGVVEVKEIIGMVPITSVPQTPAYFKGMINLRGRVVPVIDLKLKFEMEASVYAARTCIIVIETKAARMAKCWITKNCTKEECPAHGNSDHRCWRISRVDNRDAPQGPFQEQIETCRSCDFYQSMHAIGKVQTVGIIIDSVSEVLNIKAEKIEDTPTLDARLDTDCILGLAKMESGVTILLDIGRVLGSIDIGQDPLIAPRVTEEI